MMFLLLSTAAVMGQSAGFNSTYLVLQTNGGANTYYDLQATTANTDFNGANLGTFCEDATNRLTFRGAEHNVYKCGGCDLQSTRLYYRIYPAGSPAGAFVSNNIGYASGFANGCGGEDQTWSNTGYNVDLLNGLSPGTYALEVYSDATTTCSGGTVYAGNNGANYVATFTINASVTYYADADNDGFGDANVSQVSCNGAPTGYVANDNDCNDNQIQYVDDDGDGFGSTTMAACGVTNNTDCDDTATMYVDADGDGYGSHTLTACGVLNNDDCDDTMITYLDDDGDGFGSDIITPCGVSNSDDCDDALLMFLDVDGDGYGGAGTAFVACGSPNNDDCNDADATINPNAAEILYNGIDDNCDGNLDEGHQLLSQVQGSQCGSTLIGLPQSIGVNMIANATAYRFTVTNTTTNEVQVLERPVHWFRITMLPNYDYSTTYSISVEVQRNGVWLGYSGAVCTITTPDVAAAGGAAQVVSSQCGSTLPAIYSTISTNGLTGVTGYRFRVTNMTDGAAPNQVQVIDRGGSQWFSLPMLATYTYGTQYMVEVAVKTTGGYGPYGSACMITTPPVPSLTNCGGVVASPKTRVYTTALNRVTSYRYQFTNMSATPNVVTVYESPREYFTFNDIPGYAPGAQYQVNIAVMTNGVYSPYGSSCTITAPGATTRAVDVAEAPAKATPMVAVAYPNPFVSTFSINVNTNATGKVAVKVYDMTGRLLESNTFDAADMDALQMGERYPSGVYNVIVMQGGSVETLRVIKR
jgi:hypothetical protein